MGALRSEKRFALYSRRLSLMRILLGERKEPNILLSNEGPGSWEWFLKSARWEFVCMFELGHGNVQIFLSSVTALMSAYGLGPDTSYIGEPDRRLDAVQRNGRPRTSLHSS